MISSIDDRVLRRLSDLHAVYRMFDHSGRLLYIGFTKNPGGRFGQHMEKRWFLLVADIRLEWFPTKAAAALAEQRAIRNQMPDQPITLTLREAVELGVFGNRSLAAARKAAERAELQPDGARGTANLYLLPDLHALAKGIR